MPEAAAELKGYFGQIFGAAVACCYVDVQSEEMKRYPEIAEILPKVRLPLTVINGEPRFHGGFSEAMLAGAISELVH